MRILLLFCLCGLSSSLIGQCVFISEYIEGSSNNKCIEIYNGTGAAVDLAAGGYQLEIYANGSVTASVTILLTGILAANDVYVVCNSSAIAGMLAQADLTVGSMNFNGNDAVRLLSAGTTLDVIGQIGTDPGTEWDGPCCTDGTQNGTLMRKPYLGLSCPSFDGSSVFDPDTEWDCAPEDTFSDLGSYTPVTCAIDKLEVTQVQCNNGIASVELDFISGGTVVAADFELTINPDPSAGSGTFPYTGSLPMSLTGFIGDNTTQYDFQVEDANDPTCSSQLLNMTFDCPVADALSFDSEPQGCIETNETFAIQVCAVASSSGGTQPDYSQAITLSMNGSPTGTITGSLTETAVNGCATFNLSYDAAENISFTASDGTLTNGTSSTLPLAVNCPHLTMHTGMINPCGEDGPNELIAMSTGIAAVDVQDIVFASIDQSVAVQPAVRHTWSASSADVAGSTTSVCGTGFADIKCNRIMDQSIPADLIDMNDLINSLNAQAGCTLFALPPGPGMGTIPAKSGAIMFLGAGGNQSGTVAHGFHMLGTNMDFTSYCTSPSTIYVIFGQHINTAASFGFFSNTFARTYQVSIAGDITSQLSYTTPNNLEPERTTLSGGLASGGSCTPSDLFGDFVLEGQFENQIESPEKDNKSALTLFPNPATQSLTLEYDLPQTMPIHIDIYSSNGAIVSSQSMDGKEGHNKIALDISGLSGGIYHIHLQSPFSNMSQRFIKR